jgi:predicted ATPase/DNA-binding SARP family transcriptional activator
MSRLALHLLGTPRILLDGAPVGVDRRKGAALLAYLAVTGRVHSRDALATLFWPEHDQVTARANLRRTLSVLHTSLHDEWLAIDRENVALPPAEGLWVDVTEFRGCLSGCRTNGRPDPTACPPCIGQLESAAALYTDDFLAGFTLPDAPEFDDWQFRQTETLRAELSDALSRLARCQLGLGDFAGAIGHARRRVSLDPLHEPSHCQLMEALARSGDKAGALRQYQAVTDLLRRELDAAPARETAELARVISDDRLLPLAAQSAVVLTPPTAHANGATVNGHPAARERERPRRHNLPAHVTSFVGRESELAELTAWLAAPACRLITIVGPGGTGKTRLALQAAAAQVGQFEDGVYLVGLTAVSVKEFIAQSITSAIGVSLQGARDPWAALLGLLSTQHVLLVLDNLEQLLPDVDFVTELLQAAPKLKIVATSRERLNLQSEWVYDLGGLRYPAAATGADAEAFSAVELFVQRAEQQRRDFSVRDALPCILEICRLVEGMPLALELAAGWTRTMPCGEIVDELRQGIAILTTAHRDVPGRHRSMAAVFDHSWGLLTEAQQAAFRRLSVFRGGWTAEAAEQVAGADAALLAALLDKSLVQRDASGRWAMHELVRQYAGQQLRAAGEEDYTNARHAGFFSELTERAEPELITAAQPEWLRRLDAEQGNIRAALARSLDGGDCACGLAIAGAMMWYWFLRGQLLEGREWLEPAVACGRAFGATRDQARALEALGLFVALNGDLEPARQLLEEGARVGLAVGAGAEQNVASCRRYIGFCAMFKGDLAEARSIFEERLAYHRQVASEGRDRNNRRLASMLVCCSELSYAEGNLDEALTAVTEALPLMRVSGDRHALAAALDKSARIALVHGDLAVALADWRESVACSRELNIPMNLMEGAEGIGAVYALSGEPARAAILFGAVATWRDRAQVARRAIYVGLYDDIMAEAVTVLGQTEYDRLFQIGQGMTLEEALDAVAQPDSVPGGAPWIADAYAIPIQGDIPARR